ncbi:protein kinase domain-containing protein [Nocardia carnea]|uniref:protein kinase domain-containing protein n=1 Tax=Nocardia carnea TaxID=37328 RepID=UPI0024585885|nr:protein kinase [Nocardia carnea]
MVLQSGDVLSGFVIDRILGSGGMGVVYRARHPRLERFVALKVLSDALAADPKARIGFEREAALAARLDHPNIVPVHDRSGPDETSLWLSMRYISGGDANGLLAKAPGGLAPELVVELMADAAYALDFAHTAGVLHRDVKPANLLIEPDPRHGHRAVLTDFGIARALDESVTASTLAVTFAYAAPERFLAQPSSPRTDIYSLGCTLHQLLTGLPPFPRETQAAVMAAHLNVAPPSPHLLRPELPEALDAVIATVLAKQPTDRYPTCRALVDATCAALGLPPRVPAPRTAASPTAPPADTSDNTLSAPTTVTTPAARPATATAAPPYEKAGTSDMSAADGTPAPAPAHISVATDGPTTSGNSPSGTAGGHIPTGNPAVARPGHEGLPARVPPPAGGGSPRAGTPVGQGSTALRRSIPDRLRSAGKGRAGAVLGVVAVLFAVLLVVVITLRPDASAEGGSNSDPENAPARPPHVIATIPVGARPAEIAFLPDIHAGFVSNTGDDTVSMLDTNSRAVSATIPVGNEPTALAVDPVTNTVYITNKADNTVSVIDAESRRVTATIPVGSEPWDVAVDPDTHTAYVTNRLEDTVAVIDTGTRTVERFVHLSDDGPLGETARQVAVDPNTHRAYVTGIDHKTVTVIEPDNGAVTVVDTLDSTDGVTIDTGTNTAYVLNYYGQAVTAIDTRNNSIRGTIPTGIYPTELVVDPATHTAYLICVYEGTVTKIDTTTNTVGNTLSLGGTEMAGLALDPESGTAFITVRGYTTGSGLPGEVVVVDTATLTAVAEPVTVGVDPGDVAISPTGTAYVLNSAGNSVSVVTR